MAIDAILTGLGRLAGALPEARAMIGGLDDVTPIAPRVAAIGEMAKKAGTKAADVADDWGWKGGKPGEITGNKYKRALDAYRSGKITATDLDEKVLLPAFKQFERAAASGKPIAKRFNEEVAAERFVRNYAPDQPLGRQGMADIAELMLEDFYIMEKAGVPRKLTGKLISGLRGPDGLYENQVFKNMFVGSPSMQGLTELNRYARALGLTLRDMKGMTNDQRETFLQLLPRWTGSMQSAATAAKKLYKRPS